MFKKLLILLFKKIRISFYTLISDPIQFYGNICKHQPLLVVGNGKLIVKGQVDIGYFPSPYFYSGYSHFDLRGDGAKIEFGDKIFINNNCTLIADNSSIIIKDKALIGFNFTVFTSDFHNIDSALRQAPNSRFMDVVIEENVFIGSNVTVLKGVRIGQNSVIASGSIVVQNIPSNSIAAGVPCRVIREIT